LAHHAACGTRALAAANGEPFALRVEVVGEHSIGDVVWALAADRRPEKCRLPSVVEGASELGPPRCDGAQTLAAAFMSFPPTARIEGDRVVDDTIAEADAMLAELERREGSGAGFGGRGERVPMVKQGKPSVTGSLDTTIIWRIVRAHVNEVRQCYAQGLATDPELAGIVDVVFTIDARGKVSAADVTSSTLADASVAPCVAKAVRKWKFPKPSDGKAVEVSYPFHLSTQ